MKRKDSPPTIGYNFGAALVFAFLIGSALFLLLPLAQIWEAARSGGDSDNIQVVTPPPPPPPPEEQQEEIQQEEEEVEELEEETPPPTLEQLELALNADISSELGGGFQMPTFDVASDLEDMIYSISDLDQQPSVRSQQPPRYPPALKRAGISGQVLIEFFVDKEGNVFDARVIKTSNPGFNEAALDAARRWKFTPAERNGESVRYKVRAPIAFSISN